MTSAVPFIGASGVSGLQLVTELSPAAWFMYGRGITVTGAGVSQWDDQSGNGRHLKQGTDAKRPSKQVDGSIIFNGLNHILKCDAFTLNQPCTVYFLGKQITWTSTDSILDGNTSNSMRVGQVGVTPQLVINAGSAVATNSNLAVDTYGVLVAVFNGASSLLQVNNTAETTGNPGAGNAGGFAVGGAGGDASWSHIQVKEVILYSAAHDATTRLNVIRYLATVGAISV